MAKKIPLIALIFTIIILSSFTFKKKHSDLIGFWVVDGTTASQTYDVKVFDESGNFYNLYFSNGESLIALSGKYKVVDEKHYSEKVTDLRFNATYDLLDKEFINGYEFSSDKKKLILSGIVFSKNGHDTLKWSHVYKKLEVPR